jgi:hypothetical protein
MFQVFHNLDNLTDKNVFKTIKVGSIVNFGYKADPNYGHLSGNMVYENMIELNSCWRFTRPIFMLCTMKTEWNNYNHYKYNFLPVIYNDKWEYDTKSKISVVVPIANDESGDVYTCEIHDNGYVILEIRHKDQKDYYHETSNSAIGINFISRNQTLSEDDCCRIKDEYGWKRNTKVVL